MSTTNTTLDTGWIYKRASTGKIQQWRIWTEGGAYFTEEGVVDGRITKSAPHTCEGKNPGKRNETTAAQQAVKEAIANRDKKLRRGYVLTKESVDETSYRKPMKGYKWVEQCHRIVWDDNCTEQDKLNGVRSQNEADGAKSTGGEIFHTVPHIGEALRPVFDEFPEGFIDGEFFNFTLRHNLNRLVELVSVVYKPKDLTPELLAESREIVQLHVFDGFAIDGVTPTHNHIERHAAMTAMVKRLKSPYIKILPLRPVKNEKELFRRLAKNKEEKGEGLMFRWGPCHYKNGKSIHLLKLKHFDTDEFEVVDVQEGNGDWAGCAKRIVLKLHEPATTGETTCAANIEGDQAYLRRLYARRADVIGKDAQVRYQGMSEYGVLQIPWVECIRTYEKNLN